MDLDQKLKDRRIKDKENFKIYLLEFIEELKSGGLKKRVSKKSMENISKTLKQRDFQGLSFNKVWKFWLFIWKFSASIPHTHFIIVFSL